MRDYAKVAPQFWTGRTGKALKKTKEGVIVGLYLMTSPHANMIGVYHCPLAYVAVDTGLSLEDALKGLARAIEAGFCTYDEESEYVFVHEFAAYQIGEELAIADKRVQGVSNELAKVPKNQCWQGFRARYAVAYHLPALCREGGLNEAPSKPHASQEQEQEQKKREANASTDFVGSAVTAATGGRSTLPIPCPVQQIVEAYHELMPDNPRLKVLNEARKRAIAARWREAAKLNCKPFGYGTGAAGIAAWRQFFETCAMSDFLTGKTKARDGKPPFLADLDFLMSPSGFAKCLENKYHREAA
jgi:hypothetical protein